MSHVCVLSLVRVSLLICPTSPKERLNKAMVKSAWNSARDADEIFFIIDADKIIPGGSGPGRTGRKVEWLSSFPLPPSLPPSLPPILVPPHPLFRVGWNVTSPEILTQVEPLVHPVAPERLRFKKDSNEELIMKRCCVRVYLSHASASIAFSQPETASVTHALHVHPPTVVLAAL